MKPEGFGRPSFIVVILLFLFSLESISSFSHPTLTSTNVVHLSSSSSGMFHLTTARTYRFVHRQSICCSARLNRKSLSSTTLSSFDNSNDAAAAPYIKSYKLNGTGHGSKVDVFTDTGHKLATDVPKKMGGQDSAPQPVETLLAAFLGCTQATATFVGRQMKPTRVLIDRLEFENIQAFRDERGALQLPIDEAPEIPSKLQLITGTIRVFVRQSKATGSSVVITNEQLELLKEQTEIRCPVANMILSSGCKIDIDWELGSSDA